MDDNTTCPPFSADPRPLRDRLLEMFNLADDADDDAIERAIRAMVTRQGVDDLVRSRAELRAVVRGLEDQLDGVQGPMEGDITQQLQRLLEGLSDALDAASAPPHHRLTQRLHALTLELDQARGSLADIQRAVGRMIQLDELDDAHKQENYANARGDMTARAVWQVAISRRLALRDADNAAYSLGKALRMPASEHMGLGPMVELAVDALGRAWRAGFDLREICIRPVAVGFELDGPMFHMTAIKPEQLPEALRDLLKRGGRPW